MICTFERVSPKTVKVRKGGVFAGFLDLHARTQATGLRRLRMTWWEGRIDGVEIRATTLTKAKAVAEAEAQAADYAANGWQRAMTNGAEAERRFAQGDAP